MFDAVPNNRPPVGGDRLRPVAMLFIAALFVAMSAGFDLLFSSMSAAVVSMEAHGLFWGFVAGWTVRWLWLRPGP